MSALSKVRANAENLAMSTERTVTPKHLTTQINDKHMLKDFKHPKPTQAAQVISSSDGDNFAQISDEIVDDGLLETEKMAAKI
mmetsp:Transcript_13237/g.18005  ORF Transcript_13237/g.18005 Transcript_13237/m.18005 type:complete len:83 (-) Transcript_13237:864-1112(-)